MDNGVIAASTPGWARVEVRSFLGMNKKLTWYSEVSIPLYVELEVIAVGKGKGKPKGPKGC